MYEKSNRKVLLTFLAKKQVLGFLNIGSAVDKGSALNLNYPWSVGLLEYFLWKKNLNGWALAFFIKWATIVKLYKSKKSELSDISVIWIAMFLEYWHSFNCEIIHWYLKLSNNITLNWFFLNLWNFEEFYIVIL